MYPEIPYPTASGLYSASITSGLKSPIETDTVAVLWLDAADASTFTLAGNLVTQWDDKSGNNYDFAQSVSGDKPDRLDSGGGFFGVDFDEANSEHLDGSNAYTNLQNLWLGGAGGYAAFVINYDSTGAGTIRQVYTKSSFTQITIFNDASPDTNTILFTVFFSGDNGQWKSDEDVIPVGARSLVEIEYHGDAVSRDPTFWINGALVAVNEITAPTGTINDDSSSEPDLGGTDTTLTFNGFMHEVSLFSAPPSPADKISLRRYWANKWGITLV